MYIQVCACYQKEKLRVKCVRVFPVLKVRQLIQSRRMNLTDGISQRDFLSEFSFEAPFVAFPKAEGEALENKKK